MGQEFAPAPMTANTNAPPVLGRNPNTYFNLMGFQDSLRQAEVQQNTPVDPQQQQQQQQPTGLASLPGTGSMQNLAGIMPQQPYNQHPNMNPYMPQPTNKGFG